MERTFTYVRSRNLVTFDFTGFSRAYFLKSPTFLAKTLDINANSCGAAPVSSFFADRSRALVISRCCPC